MNPILDQEQKKHLIVLVPDSLAGNVELAQKVYTIALHENCDVLYLTLVDDDEKMLAVSRNMATMKAITSGRWIIVNSRLAATREWLKTLKDVYRPGDIIVCHDEQVVQNGFFQTIPVADYLRDTLHAPVRSIAGFYHPQRVQIMHWLNTLLFWLGSIAIFAGFTVLEININKGSQGFAQTFLLIFVIFLEFSTALIWNRAMNR